MSQPIVLWNTEQRTEHAFDDAGISIHKTVLAPQVSPAPYTQPANYLRTVPPLAYFCIRALTPYPDQLHNLQHPISYSEEVVCALVPHDIKKSTESDGRYNKLDTQSVDPRLWATIVQVMHPLPAEFLNYELPLSDLHLPLLQQVPSRDNFSFVTLLALPGCNEVCDETIGVLRRLNTLAALDLRGTRVGPYGLTVLVRSLSWSSDELQTRTGCWGLRILRLHSCTNIDNEALPILSKFPLLSSIDLRFTRCTPRAVSKHLAAAGFKPSSNRTLFHPSPLEVSLGTLEHLLPPPESGHSRLHSIYSCPSVSVYTLHVSKLNHHQSLHGQKYFPHIRRNLHNGGLKDLRHSGGNGANDGSDEESDDGCDEESDEGWDEETDEGWDEDNSWPEPNPTLQNSQDNTTSSIYASSLPHREYRIRAAVVNPTRTNKDHLDPLALARPPPPWSVLEAHGPPGQQHQSHDSHDTLASVGHTPLTKRHVAGMQDMITSLAIKNTRVKSQFVASTSARPNPILKSRNPFLKSRASTSKSNGPRGAMRPVFAEQKGPVIPTATAGPEKKIANAMPKFCDARALKIVTGSHNSTSKTLSKSLLTSNPHPPETSRPVEKISKPITKPLRPITSYPVPPCPTEHLFLAPQLSMKRKKGIETGLALPRPRARKDESDEETGDASETPRKRARLDCDITNTGKKGQGRERTATQASTAFPSTSNSHTPETSTSVQKDQKAPAKPLRPITTYPVPPCPIEHLLLVPQLSLKKKKGIQTELAFPRSRDESDDSSEGKVSNSKGDGKPPKKIGRHHGTTNTGEKSKQRESAFDWNKWRRTTI